MSDQEPQPEGQTPWGDMPQMGHDSAGGSTPMQPTPMQPTPGQPGFDQPVQPVQPTQQVGPSFEQPGSAATPPGWYPAEGGQRYWDGAAWTEHTSALAPVGTPSDDDPMMAVFSHLGTWFTFIVPLVIYLTRGEKSPYVKHHASEALNFAITVTIMGIASFILMIILIGFVTLLMTLAWAFIMPIIAAISAQKGEYYKYPFTLRLVPGAAV